MRSENKLVNKISQPMASNRPLPFWSWNDELEPTEVQRQISQMHEQGLGGFFMHARSGLRTEYLSEEWYKCIEAGIEKAQELNMEAWIYDEEGWPSGFAGGRVPAISEAFHAKYMQMHRVKSVEDIQELLAAHGKNIIGIYKYKASENVFSRVDSDDLSLESEEELCLVIKKNNPYYVDTLNKEAIEAFTQTTHDEYYKRFGDKFGKTVKGFFTDEPRLSCDRFGDLAWSDSLPPAFLKKYGYDIIDFLPALFLDTENYAKHRYDFWVTVNDLFVHSYMETLYNWCEEHKVKLTGHLMMEESIFSQMTSTAGVMPFYEYMHIPGIDWLRRPIASPVIAKQVGSVAAQLGNKTVLSESFALCGWDVSLEELKWIAEWQYVNGVNRICQHLEGYTIRGVRKRDYPPSLFLQQTWWEEYKVFNDYLGRLNIILSEGEQMADALLLHPMRSGYIAYDGTRTSKIRRLDDQLTQVCTRLSEKHISYHLGDETILAKHGKVEGKKLRVGKVAYKTVILPLMYSIDRETLKLLESFIKNGGRVYSMGRELEFTNGASEKLEALKQKLIYIELDTIREAMLTNGTVHISIENSNEQISDIHYQIRQSKEGLLLYMMNLSKEKTYPAQITLYDQEVNLVELDMNSGLHTSIHTQVQDGCTQFKEVFYPMQSKVILCQAQNTRQNVIEFQSEWTLTQIDNNALTLDMCRYRIDGGQIEGPISVIALQKKLMDLQGPCQIDMFFEVDIRTQIQAIQSIELVVEDIIKYDISINEMAIQVQDQGYWKDTSFRKMQINPYLCQGKNTIQLSTQFKQPQKVYDVLYGEGVYETEKNKITYDVELENIYLVGDFGVFSEDDFIEGQRHVLTTSGPFYIGQLPSTMNVFKLTQEGLLFFAGTMTLEQDLEIEKEESCQYMLDLSGQRAPMIHVYMNGQLVKKSYWAPYQINVTDYIHEGKNKLELKLYASNRNLFGPHHHIHGECYNVGPESFTGRWSWVERKSEADATEIFDRDKNYWTDQYNFVSFGISKERSQ
jgi:hypothetical protein